MWADLEADLADYFGARLDLIENKIDTKVPEQPEVLTWYYMCSTMHIPLVEGGLLDQPHMWLIEYSICYKHDQLFETTKKQMEAAAKTKQPSL